MCEPAHSTVQYRDPDKWRDQNDDDDDQGSASAQTVREGYQGRFRRWLKRFGTFCHLSIMGRGHSEAITAMSPASARLQRSLDELDHAKFETFWWDRKVIIDGKSDYMKKISLGHLVVPDGLDPLSAAQEYADAVCLGNMTAFRRFMETSMKNTDRPMAYAAKFLNYMVPKRPNLVQKKFNSIDPNMFRYLMEHRWVWNGQQSIDNNGIITACPTTPSYRSGGRVNPKIQFPLESLIKCVLGFTRRRELLTPAWAEDRRLWLPQHTG